MNKDYKNPNDYWYYHIRYNKNAANSYKGCLYSLAGIIIMVVLSLLLSSCKTVKYVPVETVRTEIINKTDTFIQKDSVFFKDSVYIHSKGDTVWYEKWHTKYKDRIVTQIVVDSFVKTDSIQVPYVVEKPLTKWQQFKQDTGGAAIILCVILLLFVVYRFVEKLKS